MATVSVRYIVHDVDDPIGFDRDALGFRVEMHPNPYFAMLSRGDLRSRGVRFRSDVITGVGVKHVILEDPSGNP